MGKKVIIIFVVALAIRLLALASFSNADSLIHKDSIDYVQTADNILHNHVYSMDRGVQVQPDNFRTPIYPLFLVPFRYIHASPYVVALVQDILFSLFIALIFKLASRIFEPNVAFWGTILLAIEPYSALLNNQLLTEWLFALFFVPAIIYAALYVKDSKNRYAYLASLLLSLAALTKPMALPLLPLVPIICLMSKQQWKERIKVAALSLVIILVISAPWVIRNRVVLGAWSYSSIAEYNIYNYNAKHFDRWLSTNKLIDTDKKPYEKLSLLEYWHIDKSTGYLSAGKNFILEYPLQYIAFVGQGYPKMFTDSGYTTLTDGLHLDSGARNIILTLGTIFFSLISLLALLDVLGAVGTNNIWPKVVILLFILAFAFFASPFGAARYRVGINQILFILAIDMIYLSWQKLALRTYRSGGTR